MSRKNNKAKPGSGGLVYSTNPDFKPEEELEEEVETPTPQRQRLLVRIDRRQRKGKEVTLVEGFQGRVADLEALGRLLKTRCGTGGSVKDGVILIQGDVRDRLMGFLTEAGYGVKRGN